MQLRREGTGSAAGNRQGGGEEHCKQAQHAMQRHTWIQACCSACFRSSPSKRQSQPTRKKATSQPAASASSLTPPAHLGVCRRCCRPLDQLRGVVAAQLAPRVLGLAVGAGAQAAGGQRNYLHMSVAPHLGRAARTAAASKGPIKTGKQRGRWVGAHAATAGRLCRSRSTVSMRSMRRSSSV